jgi:hypothetical protein
MVHCKPNHLYKFSSVAAISNRVYSGAIGNRGYEIVKVIAPVLNHAQIFFALIREICVNQRLIFPGCVKMAL